MSCYSLNLEISKAGVLSLRLQILIFSVLECKKLNFCQQDTDFKKPAYIFSENHLETKNIRYYSPSVHTAAFVLPRCYQKYFM